MLCSPSHHEIEKTLPLSSLLVRNGVVLSLFFTQLSVEITFVLEAKEKAKFGISEKVA